MGLPDDGLVHLGVLVVGVVADLRQVVHGASGVVLLRGGQQRGCLSQQRLLHGVQDWGVGGQGLEQALGGTVGQ